MKIDVQNATDISGMTALHIAAKVDVKRGPTVTLFMNIIIIEPPSSSCTLGNVKIKMVTLACIKTFFVT